MSALVVATACIFTQTVRCLLDTSEEIDGNFIDYESPSLAGADVLGILAIACLTLFHPGLAFQARSVEAKVQEVDSERC
jgi:hypothetical protein